LLRESITTVAGLDGKHVRLHGQLIYRGALHGGSHDAITGPMPLAVAENIQDLGTITLTGEIVDSKCYLGVMNRTRSSPRLRGALYQRIPPIL
jgi:hypothetical protein